LCCGCADSSLEVKIETDSNDAVEIKTEADSNDITEYPCDDGPSIGMFGLFFFIYLPRIHSLISRLIIVRHVRKMRTFFSKYADHVIAKYAAKICGNWPRLLIRVNLTWYIFGGWASTVVI